MSNKSKSNLNNLESSTSLSETMNKKQNDFKINYTINSKEEKREKDEGFNDWNSVPLTYDKEESMHEHEKSATNNQWCSTSK